MTFHLHLREPNCIRPAGLAIIIYRVHVLNFPMFHLHVWRYLQMGVGNHGPVGPKALCLHLIRQSLICQGQASNKTAILHHPIPAMQWRAQLSTKSTWSPPNCIRTKKQMRAKRVNALRTSGEDLGCSLVNQILPTLCKKEAANFIY